MTTTIVPTTTTTTVVRPAARPALWSAAATSGVVAAAATTAIAAGARAADVPLAISGESIPIAGFAQLTLFGTLIGFVLAKVFAAHAHSPRRTFVAVTAALTVLSLVPDAVADASAATKLVLMLTHVVAAAIVVPVLAARLATTRPSTDG